MVLVAVFDRAREAEGSRVGEGQVDTDVPQPKGMACSVYVGIRVSSYVSEW